MKTNLNGNITVRYENVLDWKALIISPSKNEFTHYNYYSFHSTGASLCYKGKTVVVNIYELP